MIARRVRTPRYVVTINLDQSIHDWLRDQAAVQLGDDRHIGKIISSLVRAEMVKEEQPATHALAD